MKKLIDNKGKVIPFEKNKGGKKSTCLRQKEVDNINKRPEKPRLFPFSLLLQECFEEDIRRTEKSNLIMLQIEDGVLLDDFVKFQIKKFLESCSDISAVDEESLENCSRKIGITNDCFLKVCKFLADKY